MSCVVLGGRGRVALVSLIWLTAAACTAGNVSRERAAACGAACVSSGPAEGDVADAASNGDATPNASGDGSLEPAPDGSAQTADGALGSDAGGEPSTDPNDFFGAPRCSGSGLALCDDFEAEAVGTPPDPGTWMIEDWGSGSAVIDDTHAARGQHAVHFHSPAGTSKIVMTQRKTLPAASNHLFGRMFLYVERIPQPFRWDDRDNFPLVHWTAVSATGSYVENGTTYHPELRPIGGINQNLLLNLDGGPDSEVAIDDMPPAGHESIAEGAWMCLEFELAGSGEGAEVRVWWDGIEHEYLHLTNSSAGDSTLWPIPIYDSLSFGFTHYQDYASVMPEGFDVWIDAVAVDGQRIGCQR